MNLIIIMILSLTVTHGHLHIILGSLLFPISSKYHYWESGTKASSHNVIFNLSSNLVIMAKF